MIFIKAPSPPVTDYDLSADKQRQLMNKVDKLLPWAYSCYDERLQPSEYTCYYKKLQPRKRKVLNLWTKFLQLYELLLIYKTFSVWTKEL